MVEESPGECASLSNIGEGFKGHWVRPTYSDLRLGGRVLQLSVLQELKGTHDYHFSCLGEPHALPFYTRCVTPMELALSGESD